MIWCSCITIGGGGRVGKTYLGQHSLGSFAAGGDGSLWPTPRLFHFFHIFGREKPTDGKLHFHIIFLKILMLKNVKVNLKRVRYGEVALDGEGVGVDKGWKGLSEDGVQRSTMLPSQPRVCWPINQREPVGWRKSEHVIPSFAKKNPFPITSHYEYWCPCNTRTIKVSSSMTKIVSEICSRIIL